MLLSSLQKWLAIGGLLIFSLSLLIYLVTSILADRDDKIVDLTTANITITSQNEDKTTDDKLHEANTIFDTVTNDTVIDSLLPKETDNSTNASEQGRAGEPTPFVDKPGSADLGSSETDSSSQCKSSVPYFHLGEQAIALLLQDGIIPESLCPCGGRIVLTDNGLIEVCN